MEFMETSALKGTNVQEALDGLAERIVAQMEEKKKKKEEEQGFKKKAPRDQPSNSYMLKADGNKKEKRKCCK